MGEETSKPKKVGKEPQPQLPPVLSNPFQNTEGVKLGEISMWSEVLRADQLLSLILGALKNSDVKKYLQLLDVKKERGLGVS